MGCHACTHLDPCLPKPDFSLLGAITIQLVKYFLKFPKDALGTKILVCILDAPATKSSYITNNDFQGSDSNVGSPKYVHV